MLRRPRRCAAALLAFAAAAHAADGDMRVLTDEITERGEVELELQLATVRKPRDAALEGKDSLRSLVEISYGLADDWEASVQLPAVRTGGTSYLEGINLEFQYVAPHDTTEGAYYGIRIEVGYAGEAGESRHWTSELKPIAGYRNGAWHGVVNAGFTAPLGGDDRRVSVEPILRVVHEVSRRSALGFEYRVDLGPIADTYARADRQEVLLAVLDTRWRKIEFTFGLGKGLNAHSDGVTGKVLASFELDD